jgi:hypothetical protein
MEMTFQKVILTIAVVGLILMLVIIGLSMYKSTSSGMVWPPMVGSCPDYWLDLKGNGEQCYNVKSLGICNLPRTNEKNTMNFNVSPFNGDDGTCSKYTWANNCKVTWDGITYGVKNPCDKTSTEEPESSE